MQLNKSTAVMDYKLVTEFDELRQQLAQKKFADRIKKPLAYWAVASDRRLPLAFMGRSLKELLDTPFDELFCTAGIGQKKIRTFLMLLHRAAQPKPPGAIEIEQIEDHAIAAAEVAEGRDVLDPNIVCEALWVQWRASIRKHGLEQEPLGRYVGTLLDMPRVIWQKPLGEYARLSLAQIRSLRTHGEKRVGAILEVFGSLHQILVHLNPESRLAVRIVPRFLVPVEEWTLRWLNHVAAPHKEEIQEALVKPLLEQVRIDAGPEIARLAEHRLQWQASSVRKSASRMGLTRARIYQLLAEASEVIALRWPAGASLAAQLRDKLKAEGADRELLAWMDEIIELFFLRGQGRLLKPQSLRGASSPNSKSNGRGPAADNGHRAGAKTTEKSHSRPDSARR